MQCCGGSCARALWGCCRLLHTFDFISSRPTVVTVLVWGLLLLSCFCGLSRRCSRCFIIWSPPERNNGGAKRQKDWEGQEKQGGCRRVKGSFPMMSTDPPPRFYFIHTCLAVSRRLAGGLKSDTAETGAHFTISACSTFWADISFLQPGNRIKLLTRVINIYTAGLQIFGWFYLRRTLICTHMSYIYHFTR